MSGSTDVMTKEARDNFEFQKIIVVLGFTLLIIKYIAYFLTGSVAIFTDATESIVNVVAACVGIYALYLSAQPADKTHPFGHGKVEVISSAIEGTMIMVAGALIILESIQSFLHPGEISQLDIGLVLVFIAAVANYVVGRAAIRKGRKNRSPALEASGKHLCSDTYSSIGILIGLVIVYVAMWMGYDARWLDSTIAIIFGFIILYTGIGVIRRSMDETMDRADDELIGQVTDIINEYRHDDWIDVYNLRLIKYGPKIYIDMKVVFPRNMTVTDEYSEKQEIDEAVRAKFGDSFETSITCIPCSDFHCRHCQRNCFLRTMPFETRTEWNANNICNDKTHAPGNLVTIHRD